VPFPVISNRNTEYVRGAVGEREGTGGELPNFVGVGVIHWRLPRPGVVWRHARARAFFPHAWLGSFGARPVARAVHVHCAGGIASASLLPLHAGSARMEARWGCREVPGKIYMTQLGHEMQ
jgi:hypothetical protein